MHLHSWRPGCSPAQGVYLLFLHCPQVITCWLWLIHGQNHKLKTEKTHIASMKNKKQTKIKKEKKTISNNKNYDLFKAPNVSARR